MTDETSDPCEVARDSRFLFDCEHLDAKENAHIEPFTVETTTE